MAVRPDLAGITNPERGLALGPTALRPVPKDIIRAVDIRDGARNLGLIFIALGSQNQRLDDWALPTHRTAMDERTLPWQLDGPTRTVFGANVSDRARIREYDDAHELLMPEVARTARAWATDTLKEHIATLKSLGREVDQPGFVEWMHKASELIVAKAADCRKPLEESYRAEMSLRPSSGERARAGLPAYRGGDWPEIPGRIARHCFVRTTESFIQGELLVVEADERAAPQPRYDFLSPSANRKTYVELLQVVRCLKQFPEVVEAYARSGVDGSKLLKRLLETATSAVKDFSDTLTSHPSHVWLYPALIIGSVRRLKLDDVPGFQDYALAIGQVLASKTPEKLLSYVGAGLLIIGLALEGPPGIVYLTVDLAAGSSGAAFAYMRARERELAVKASLFLPDEQKFATEYGYGETILAVVFGMLATYSLVRTARAVAPASTAGAKGAPQNAPARSPTPSQPTQAPKKLEPLPPRGTPETPAGTPAGTATGTPAATATGTPAAAATGTPAATATGTQAVSATGAPAAATGSSAIDPKIAERIAPKIRKAGQQPSTPVDKTPVRPTKPAGKATEPVNRAVPDDAADKAPPSKPKEKAPSRATSQAQKALPPNPQPPETSARFTDGAWRKEGKLNVNEGGLNFEGKATKSEVMPSGEFERGFNQQLAERLAKRVSNKPVRKDVPEMPGYESPSTGKTSRLKFQATRRGGELTRRPEATMEIVENTPATGTVTETHFFEATTQRDFQPIEWWQGQTQIGHKQKQLTGTVWQSSAIPRQGYSDSTKFYYHIMSPNPPSETTIGFLNKLLNENPNLEINWFVVKSTP